VPDNPVDDESIEGGWSSMFSASNPIDNRTIALPSYRVDEEIKEDLLLMRHCLWKTMWRVDSMRIPFESHSTLLKMYTDA